MSVHLRGSGASPGRAVGRVWRYPARSATGGPRDAAAVIADACEEAAHQLDLMAVRLERSGHPDAGDILDAQALIALDPVLCEEATRRAEAGDDPREAVLAAAEAIGDAVAAVDDRLIASRADDIRDVAARIARIIGGERLQPPAEPSVALATDIPPSVVVEMPAGRLLGLALEGGSPTAHVVLLGRALGIPVVVGVEGLIETAAAAETVALDGDTGAVVVDPDAAERAPFERPEAVVDIVAAPAGPSATADGHRVSLMANVATPADAARAVSAGADGIGLFRTEFLFLGRASAPTELEQVAAYREAMAAFGPDRPVVIRLADIGGDKAAPYLDIPLEPNPMLGVRGIRLAYWWAGAPRNGRELLVTQLRAVSRAGALAGVVPRVMAPMVSTVEDARLFLDLCDEARRGLVEERLEHSPEVRAGIMVELPSTALLAADLAPLVDFFSLGTNDLAQYALAADRAASGLAQLQDGLQPAVLRAVNLAVKAARSAGIGLSACGELAGEPAGAAVLVGLGVDELSVDLGALDSVRETLGRLPYPALVRLAEEALRASTVGEVRRLAAEVLAR